MIAYSAYKGYKANKEKKAHEGGGNAAPDEVYRVSPAAQEHYAPPQQQQHYTPPPQQQQYAPPQHEKPQQQQYGTSASTHHVLEYSHSMQQPAEVYPNLSLNDGRATGVDLSIVYRESQSSLEARWRNLEARVSASEARDAMRE